MLLHIRLLAAAVGPRDQFEYMPVRVQEVNTAAAVMPVDLTGFRSRRIGPVFELHFLDPAERGIEFVLGNEKREVLDRDMLSCFKIVDRDVVRQIDHKKVVETP